MEKAPPRFPENGNTHQTTSREHRAPQTLRNLQELTSAALSQPTTTPARDAESLRDARQQLASAEQELIEQNTELQETRNIREADQRRYRELFEFAPDAYLVTDLDGVVEEANRPAARLLGTRSKDLIGKPLVLFAAEGERHRFHTLLNTQAHRAEPAHWELIFSPRDSEPVDASITVAYAYDTRHGTAHLRWLVRDITERRTLEREIAEISSREQQRIGHNLHDGVAQELTGIAFLADTLRQELSEESSAHAEQARRIAQLTNAAIDHTRELVYDLCPAHLQHEGLVTALEGTARHTEDVFGVRCTVHADSSFYIPNSAQAMQLYYIAREAIHNAVRHGRAEHLRLTLRQAGRRAKMTIEDDGTGLDVKEAQSSGRGVRIMQHRAKMIRGTLQLDSPGHYGGTAVVCTFDNAGPSD